MSGAEADLIIERRDSVLWLTLNRPKAANALSKSMQELFCAGLVSAESDPGIQAAVITGTGRVFSAGADLRGNPDNLSPQELATQRAGIIRGLLAGVLDFRKPLIASLNGPAVGGGCMMALLTDQVVMSETAFLSLPEIDVGMPSPLGYTIVEMMLNGRIASDLIQSGRRIAANEAKVLGIAEVSPPEDLTARSQAAAEFFGKKPLAAFAVNKEWSNGPRKERVMAALAAAQRYRDRASAGTDPNTAR